MRSILTIMAIEHTAPGVRTVAEVNNPKHEPHFRRADVNELLVTSKMASHLLARTALYPGLSSIVTDIVSGGEGSELYRIGLPDEYIGLSIDAVAARLRTEHQATLLSVNRGGHAFVNPQVRLRPGARRRRHRRGRVAGHPGAARGRRCAGRAADLGRGAVGVSGRDARRCSPTGAAPLAPAARGRGDPGQPAQPVGDRAPRATSADEAGCASSDQRPTGRAARAVPPAQVHGARSGPGRPAGPRGRVAGQPCLDHGEWHSRRMTRTGMSSAARSSASSDGAPDGVGEQEALDAVAPVVGHDEGQVLQGERAERRLRTGVRVVVVALARLSAASAAVIAQPSQSTSMAAKGRPPTSRRSAASARTVDLPDPNTPVMSAASGRAIGACP